MIDLMQKIAVRGAAVVAAAFVFSTAGEVRADLPWLPPASDTAAQFIAAWTASDFEEMVVHLDEDAAGPTPTALQADVEDALRAGAITRYSVTLREPIDEPELEAPPDPDDALTVQVPFGIEYRSEAVARPIELTGSFRLTYDAVEDAWEVPWERSLLWPGVEGAEGFAVSFRWPERAPLLDRNGSELAVGDGPERSYPFGALAGSTVGHLAPAEDDVQGKELVGGSGLEAAFEEELAGRPGTDLAIVDASGATVKDLGGSEPAKGKPVKVTLDVDVQQAAENAFGGTVGGAVVLDPSTGDLLAIVSSAELDPNGYVGVGGITPFNRALSGLYPPGSVMKVVTASAGLDTGTVDETTELIGVKEYQGVRNFESGDYGSIDFASALRFSVNTSFAQLAEMLGAETMTEYSEAFGFNRVPSMPLRAATSSFPSPATLSDLMWGSIGQAQVLATPIQMATVAATIANDGERMEPRISLDVKPAGERAVSKKTAEIMNRLMQSVVVSGTGVAANISGVAVAGKTGTAEVDVDGKRKEHAWFIAFAPADDPKIAVAVVAELGGVGGRVAAPLARAIIQGVLPLIP